MNPFAAAYWVNLPRPQKHDIYTYIYVGFRFSRRLASTIDPEEYDPSFGIYLASLASTKHDFRRLPG